MELLVISVEFAIYFIKIVARILELMKNYIFNLILYILP